MESNSHAEIRYIAYVRKSTEGEEKQVLSIESQKQKVRELFSALPILEVVEERKSAFLPENRPAFARMIERIRSGEAQGIIAWHPDRLSRNELDAATLTYMIRTGAIRDLKFGSYHFDNSPEGIMMLQMALSHSQYFSAKLSKDVKRGLDRKVEMGWFPGRAPAGYVNTPSEKKGFKVVKKDPRRFALVRKMWDLMLTGSYTPVQILDIATREWGYRTPDRGKPTSRPVSRSTIYRLFTNPFYYGWFEYPRGSGHWRQGRHEAMVSRQEFDRVQMLLGRRGRPVAHHRVFAFTGLIRCGECGCQVTAEEKRQVICSRCKRKFSCITRTACPQCETPIQRMRNPTLLRYVYYHCTRKRPDVACGQGSVEAKELEAQIDELLAGVQINEKYLQWAIRHLKDAHRRERATRDTILESQQQAHRRLCQKLDALLEMRLAREIGEEAYRRKKGELEREKSRYEALLNDTGERQKKWLELSERTFQFACYARYWFAEGDDRRKREILATLGSNLILRDKRLSIQAAEPFALLQRGLESVPEARGGFEPGENRTTKRNEAPSEAMNPAWLPVCDRIRTLLRHRWSALAIPCLTEPA